MKTKIKQIVNVTLVASLLAGCAEAAMLDDGTSDGLAGDGGEQEEDGTGEGGGDGDGDGEYLPPDDDDPDLDPDPDPQGRIIWVGDADGDVIVHATLGSEVAAHYPEGVAYEIRLDEDGQAMYAQIVDAQAQVLDLVRVAKRAPILYPAEEETVLSYCFPFPFVPPITANCFVAPCPWDDGWPGQGAPWPNCLEVSQSSGLVRAVGAIDGTPVGQELVQGVDPVPMFDTPLTLAQSQRLDTVALVAADIASLQPEVDNLDLDCLDCMMIGGWIVSNTAKCVQADFQACADAYWGYTLYEQNCKDGCAP